MKALASAGQWQEAHAWLTAQRGIGKRMFDGRQIAVVATLTAGHTTTARALLADTTPGEPWEEIVTACLNAHTRRKTGTAVDVDGLLGGLGLLASIGAGHDPGSAAWVLFHTRLALAVLDALGDPDRALIATTTEHALASRDGYAARDLLTHPDVRPALSERQTETLTAITQVCGLDRADLPHALLTDLNTAMAAAENVILDQ